jgi:hypothetical protein
MWYRKRTKIWGGEVAVLLVLLLCIGTVHAVDDLGLFELEGNAIQDVPAPPDDWETLYNGGGSSIVFTGVITDPGQDTIFVGGRKDIQDIPDWGWKNDGGFPDKDDITNAYAAGYSENGDLIVYFGADRFSNKGDAYLAFWFFQNQVGLNLDGTFYGEHAVGDILVLVNYPQSANKSPEINVVEWNPAEADVAKNLKQILTGAVCSGGGGLACATTNSGDETSPWIYMPKSGDPNVFPYESLYEGGINLTQLLGSTPCFGSFMAESRSSEKFTATLKDFVIGDFPVCGISVSKTCNVLRLTDQNDLTDKFFVVDFSGEVTNTGAGDLPAGSILTVVDDAGTPGDTSDDVTIEEILGSPLLVGESIPFSGEFFSNSNPPYNTVKASLAFSGATVEADPYSVECTYLPLDPNLSLSKICWIELTTIDSLLVVEVFFSGEVCNIGDVPLNVTVIDDKVGILLQDILIAPGDCETVEGSYLPSQADGNVNNPCEAMFSDTLTAVGTSPIPGVEDQIEERTANCPLCDCD